MVFNFIYLKTNKFYYFVLLIVLLNSINIINCDEQQQGINNQKEYIHYENPLLTAVS